MLIAFLAFIVVTGGIVAAFFGLSLLPGFLAGRQLDRRLREAATPEASGPHEDSTIIMRPAEGPLPAVDRLLYRSAAGGRLQRLIEQSGTKTTPSAIVLTSMALGAGAGFLTLVFATGRFAAWIALAVALLGCAAPFAWLAHRRGARLKRFEEHFPEALDLMSRAIRAGHAFQTAMGMAADELREPVGPEFKKAFDQQNFGLPLRDALNQLSERVPILDVRFFVTAVLIQRDTGGNLAEILDNLAHVVRERFKIKRQVRVHTAHGRFTGYVLLALPAALAVALSFINPDHMQLLFREHLGQMMLVGTLVLQFIGFVWIRQVIRIEV